MLKSRSIQLIQGPHTLLQIAMMGRKHMREACICFTLGASQVLDSPFSRLRDLMVELCEEQKLPIPRPFMRLALSMMRRSVRKRAGFSIDDVSPLDVVPGSFIPALFGKRLTCRLLHFLLEAFLSMSSSCAWRSP